MNEAYEWVFGCEYCAWLYLNGYLKSSIFSDGKPASEIFIPSIGEASYDSIFHFLFLNPCMQKASNPEETILA